MVRVTLCYVRRFFRRPPSLPAIESVLIDIPKDFYSSFRVQQRTATGSHSSHLLFFCGQQCVVHFIYYDGCELKHNTVSIYVAVMILITYALWCTMIIIMIRATVCMQLHIRVFNIFHIFFSARLIRTTVIGTWQSLLSKWPAMSLGKVVVQVAFSSRRGLGYGMCSNPYIVLIHSKSTGNSSTIFPIRHKQWTYRSI